MAGKEFAFDLLFQQLYKAASKRRFPAEMKSLNLIKAYRNKY